LISKFYEQQIGFLPFCPWYVCLYCSCTDAHRCCTASSLFHFTPNNSWV